MFNFTMAFSLLGSIIGVVGFALGSAIVCGIVDKRFGSNAGWATFITIYSLVVFLVGGLLL